MMVYPGTKVGAVSSNPIAFAVPRANGRPYLIDFSTGVVANGKIMGAADRGEKIPVGWGVDKDGRDTTDPRAVETVLPMAGIKGAGLSFMIECLSSLLLSDPRIAPDLEDWVDRRRSVPQRLADRDQSSGVRRPADVRARGGAAGPCHRRTARAEGVDRIMLPGERGDAIRAEREKSGIPVPTRNVAAYRQGGREARCEGAGVMGLRADEVIE